MDRKRHHIYMLFLYLLLVQGCFVDLGPVWSGGSDMVLTVKCDEAALTKADPDAYRRGELNYNENLIKAVDFLFYPGENPSLDDEAVYHIRKVFDENSAAQESAEFNLIVKKNIVEQVFDQGNPRKATVYVLVNNLDESFFDDGSSLRVLANKQLETDFAAAETGYVQSCFLMDGKEVLSYNENSEPSVVKTINVSRFASKITVAVKVEDEVILHHAQRLDEHGLDVTEPDEKWTPVMHTMRIYLVDGVKALQLSHDGATLPDPEARDARASGDVPAIATADYYFSYSGAKRPFVENDNTTPSVRMSGEEGYADYYETWPMYSYPREWSVGQWQYGQIDYTAGRPHEQPYLKLEMDWRREEYNGYSYDLRKYYYKIYLPFAANELVRNHWYSLFIDVGILGSETDEGKAILQPTCYILDWQNKSQVINKQAVIAAARYLSVDKSNWELHNQTSIDVPFISSHDVMIVDGSLRVTRPFYGKIANSDVTNFDNNPDYCYYNNNFHAWVKRDASGRYYLDYVGQPEGNESYEPSRWLTPNATSIGLSHTLQPDFTQLDFDYSPYTIEFDINHTDLTDQTSTLFRQYVKHLKIVQYPGIYIEAIRNSDTEIKYIRGADPDNNSVYGYPTGEEPWLDGPWGYTYVNAGRGRIVRQYKDNISKDPFSKLSNPNGKREYQWQTVYYSGGARDMFTINVTVLPSNSSFIIGDPRSDVVDNLVGRTPYHFETADQNDINILGYDSRDGFFDAPALYGASPRTLQWYYPTENSSRTKDMLAPSYRFSSKFNGTEYGGNEFGNMTKDYAEYRCAAYQEDGFPAGRWRLPTKAEIHFVAQLSAKGAFDKLFSNSTYWSANGAITVNGNSVSDSGAQTALLRCVYDAWYWDEYDDQGNVVQHDPRNQFIWGDKER